MFDPRFAVRIIKADGALVFQELLDESDKAMRLFVSKTKENIEMSLGVGSYVALIDNDLKLDASRVSEGHGCYKFSFGKEDGRLAFETMEKMMANESALIENESAILGDAHGVNACKNEKGGYTIKFTFDRGLSKMMDRVPGAVYEKGVGYLVPESSSGVLAKTVSSMRQEVVDIVESQKAMKELALLTAKKAQIALGTGSDVEPQITSFREPGKFYGGEIVNANSHFIAQLTGFGSKDGASFVMIHRIADLDRDNLMKGDSIGVRYDDKFLGKVSDLSKTMSVDELSAHFEENLGKQIDGVTVTDRGDQIGLSFAVHPVLVPRIRMVDGASFNRDDGVWEVPKRMKEFALRAAEDMRREFVLDSKEIAALSDVAASKIDGAKVYKAFSKDGTSYSGPIIDVGKHYALQKTGRDGFTLHHLSMLDNLPEKNQNLSIKYGNGVGVVIDHDLKREQSQGRSGR